MELGGKPGVQRGVPAPATDAWPTSGAAAPALAARQTVGEDSQYVVRCRIAAAGLQHPAFESMPRCPSSLPTAVPKPKRSLVHVCFRPEDLIQSAAEVARDLQVRIPEGSLRHLSKVLTALETVRVRPYSPESW